MMDLVYWKCFRNAGKKHFLEWRVQKIQTMGRCKGSNNMLNSQKWILPDNLIKFLEITL